MPRAKPQPRGRRDFCRTIARAKSTAAQHGLLSKALHEAAKHATSPGAAELLKAVADQGHEHRGEVEEGLDRAQ